MVRRRRASGGPAERAFGTLVGLQLRPKRLREAVRMWNMVAERGDISARDSLWEHPDILPSSEEIDRPALLLERLGLAGETPGTAADDFDRALEQLLNAEGAVESVPLPKNFLEQSGAESDEQTSQTETASNPKTPEDPNIEEETTEGDSDHQTPDDAPRGDSND